jgi:lincosamide nucleotidyltransferase A/C/D/E
MDARSAVAIIERLESSGITVRVDGGWGIDALIGAQTRPHGDLDLVVAKGDCAWASTRPRRA